MGRVRKQQRIRKESNLRSYSGTCYIDVQLTLSQVFDVVG